MPMSSCPSDDQLTNLLADALGPAEWDAHARHVEECASCQEKLARLTKASDTGNWGRAEQAPLDSHAEETLMRRLKQMPFWLPGTVPMPAPRPADHRPLGLFRKPPPGSSGWPVAPGYEILEELGRGGMGVVYQARQLGLHRIVALKMVLAGIQAGPKELARFRAEAEAIARLQHPNIVQIYDVGEAAGRPFFVLEYVAGGSLAQHLQGKPQPVRIAAQLVETLARAVHAAHSNGVIHRDLKPANVLLQVADSSFQSDTINNPAVSILQSAIPKITDFGVAKCADGDGAAPDFRGATVTGELLGTPNYMAPEQAMVPRQPVGPAADIYALGAILYELLTGRPPFVGETPLATVLQTLHNDPVSVTSLQPNVPRDLETICLKCLRKDPTRRYTSALELAEDLRRFLADEPIQARPPTAFENLWRWMRR